jgi:hypothetical protein
MIIHDKREILKIMFTTADVDDREPLKQGSFQTILRESYVLKRIYRQQPMLCRQLLLIVSLKRNPPLM